MPVVEVQGLRRVFKGRGGASNVVALDNVDLAVEGGTIHGLFGPTGPGTNLVKILATVLVPTAGAAKVVVLHLRSPTHIRCSPGREDTYAERMT